VNSCKLSVVSCFGVIIDRKARRHMAGHLPKS
jgi:hypothetical protein